MWRKTSQQPFVARCLAYASRGSSVSISHLANIPLQVYFIQARLPVRAITNQKEPGTQFSGYENVPEALSEHPDNPLGFAKEVLYATHATRFWVDLRHPAADSSAELSTDQYFRWYCLDQQRHQRLVSPYPGHRSQFWAKRGKFRHQCVCRRQWMRPLGCHLSRYRFRDGGGGTKRHSVPERRSGNFRLATSHQDDANLE